MKCAIEQVGEEVRCLSHKHVLSREPYTGVALNCNSPLDQSVCPQGDGIAFDYRAQNESV